MAADGHLNFDTRIDTTGFNSGAKQVNSSASNLSSGIKSSFGKIGAIVASAFAVTKLVEFGKTAIETASDIAEVQNVVDVAFGKMSDKMEDFANKAVETYGISQLTAKQTGSTFMAMAKGMGIADDSASDMAITLTGLSADMASFYNVEQEVASTALNSIFTGETETLKKFGIVMTEANLSAFALSQGITKNISDMTQAEKVQLRYLYVMSQTSLAQGDFARTSDGWANQTRMLSEKWKELSGIIGKAFLNVLLPAVRLLNKALSALIDYATRALKALSKLFGWDIKEDTASKNTVANQDKTAQLSSDTADNLKKSEKTEKAIAKATKKTNKERARGVATYDKLNILQKDAKNATTPTSSGSGKDKEGGGSTAALDSALKKVKKKTKKATAEGLKDGISEGFKKFYEMSGLSDFVGEIQKGVNQVDFGAIKKNFLSIYKSLIPIAQAYMNGVLKVNRAVMKALGSLIGGLIAVYGKWFQTLTGGVAQWLNKDGKRIADSFNTFFSNIAAGFNNLSTFFNTVFGAIGKSIDQMRSRMEKSISNLLSGFTSFGIAIGTILSSAFKTATEVLSKWARDNSALITSTFNTLQSMIADVMDFIGGVFNDIGTILSNWWNSEGGGSELFRNICEAFTAVGTTLMNVFNKWIKPAWNFIVGVFNSAWTGCLKPIFESLVKFFGKVWNLITILFKNYLLPLVNWIVSVLGPYITSTFNAVKGVFETVFGVIGSVISGALDALGGLIDFLTGVFTGDWKKAWKGIRDYFGGIWKAIKGIAEGSINLIIDGINLLWTAVYNVVKGIVDDIGGIASSIGLIFGQKWGWKAPDQPPLIPHVKLASGTVVPANYGEFAAILGDNKKEPEVVSPLSTMKQAFKEALAESGQGGGSDTINLTLNLDGEKIYSSVIKHDKDNYKRTGQSAFAY